jgi:hypothetical protein
MARPSATTLHQHDALCGPAPPLPLVCIGRRDASLLASFSNDRHPHPGPMPPPLLFALRHGMMAALSEREPDVQPAHNDDGTHDRLTIVQQQSICRQRPKQSEADAILVSMNESSPALLRTAKRPKPKQKIAATDIAIEALPTSCMARLSRRLPVGP